MINLIPPDGKRIVQREYLARVLSVGALALALAVGASALMLFPTYVLLIQQLRIDETAASVSNEAHAAAVAELAASKVIADRLRIPKDSVRTSEILIHIERSLAADVSLSSISVSSDAAKRTIQAVGSAKSREALRGFTERLKADSFFLDATVPVSDLARDVDLSFTLTLTLEPKPAS